MHNLNVSVIVYIVLYIYSELSGTACPWVSLYLHDGCFQAEILAALDKVCNLMPDTIRSECVNFVNTYGKMIVELIVTEAADPKTVCTALTLCSADLDLVGQFAAKVTLLKEKPKVTPLKNEPTGMLARFER